MLSATSVAPPQLDEFFLESDLPLGIGELTELERSRAAGTIHSPS